jgi:outer membrane receptor protein involved in Fe transport
MLSSLRKLSLCVVGLLIFIPAWSEEEESSSGRQIEEIIVYGERIQSTVSDTSISITAMSEEFLMDMGIQGPDEMVNFIPATTRTDWDIKIRGIGRNFRGLGGDPGVGTYYNGVYSPDFGIASTEGGLYDIQRIEVLRGPQGTLYGRNSIGGVVNYVTNPANHKEFEAQVRWVGGQYNTSEGYAVVSGPLTDSLAYRINASKRTADGRVEGMGDSEDMEAVNDANVVLMLDWNISDTMTLNLRANDRESEGPRNFGNGGHGILSEGPCITSSGAAATSLDECNPLYRVARDTNHFVPGLRVVSADDPSAKFPFVHPTTGETIWAAYKRPGVDPIPFPYMPSANYQNENVAAYNGGDNSKPNFKSLTNNAVNEIFDHNSASLTFDWDIAEEHAIKYLYSYQNFMYYFNRDNDFSDAVFSRLEDTVDESVFSFSHELRYFWAAGDRWTGTSGLYYFQEDRDQLYGIRNRTKRVTEATPYSPLIQAIFAPACYNYKTVALGTARGVGAWCGEGDGGRELSITNDNGGVYEHDNNVLTTNKAIYTQADYQMTDTMYVTLGVRYSEDHRDALEQAGLRIEIWDDAAWIQPLLAGITGDERYLGEGMTPTAALNIAQGSATFTGDPLNPIESVCALTDADCANPLWLTGLPLGWGSRVPGEYETSNTSFRVNLNWEPTPDHLIYAGVTTSYRAGGFNMGGADNRVEAGGLSSLVFYEDEELTAYEIGFKSAFWDNRAQVTGALYYYDYREYQDHLERWEDSPEGFVLPSGIEIAPPGRGPVEITDNIPKAHNAGFEIDAVVLATDSWTVGGNYSYTESVYDTAYTIFNEDDPRYPREIMGGDVNQDPCTLSAEIKVLYCLEVDGVQLAGIPKHKATAWTSYQWAFDMGTLTAYGSYAYTGEYFTNTFARPWDEVPERHRVDARLSFDSADQTWSASLFVDNVLDETYLRWSDMEPRRSGYGINFPQRVVALMPRYIGFEVVYNFL